MPVTEILQYQINTLGLVEIETEHEIVERSKKDPFHFRILYERYFKTMFLFIHKRTNDLEISGDLTSQVFVKALTNIKHYENRGFPFSTWLYRIAVNEVNLYYRKTRKERIVKVDDANLLNLAEEFSDDGAENITEEMIARLVSLMAALKTEEVHLLELRFFENCSFKEISEILQVAEDTVKKKTYRLLEKLRKQLNDFKV